MDIEIVTGGQTGVDRGALDAALRLGIRCSGWCPQGREAEDGCIPARYPLQELPGGGYAERTRRNVEDSDATLVIDFGGTCPGTDLTCRHAHALGRPLLVIDANRTGLADAAGQVRDFLRAHRIGRLNVAGPRESGAPGAGAWASALVSAVFGA